MDQALALDPQLGEAHTARALFLRNLGRFDESELEWRRAIELVPGHANTRHWYGGITRHWYGGMLWEVGRFDESRIEMRRALALDPLSRIIGANVGLGEYFARRYGAAIAQYRRALDRYPDFSYTWILLSLAYSLNGQHQEAVEAGRTALEISPGDANYTQVLASVLARAGDEAEARSLMASVEGSDPTRLALVHVALGEADEALRLLETAVDGGSPFIIELGDPAYDPIRADPRFQDLLPRVGLID